MKKINKIIAIIESVSVAANGVWLVYSLMNGKIELGAVQIFNSLTSLIIAIYFTLEAKDG